MITICVCDDSAVSIAQIKILLTQFQEDFHVVFDLHIYESGQNLLTDFYNGIYYQIYFLDVVMPNESGIEIARHIRETDEKAGIFFLTASPEYALEAFSVAATDYLIKPVQYDALTQALFRILTPPKSSLPDNLLIVNSGSNEQKIPCQNICYIDERKRKISLILNTAKTIQLDDTSKQLEKELSLHKEFVRIHRSYIINMKYIREIGSKEVTLIPNHHLPLSKPYIVNLKSEYFSYIEQN